MIQAKMIATHAALALKLLLAIGVGLAVGTVVQVSVFYGGLKYLAILAVLIGTALVVAVFGAERVFVGLILVNLALQLDVHVGLREEGTYNAIAGMPVSLTTISLVMLILWRVVVQRPLLPPSVVATQSRRRVWRSCGVFVAISILSVAFAADRLLAMFEAVVLVQATLAYIYVEDATKRLGLRFVLSMLFAGLVFQGTTLVLQSVGIPILGASASSATAGTEIVERAGGWLGHPNLTAMYLSVVGLIAVAGVLWRGGRPWNALAWGALTMTAVGLALTVSRGGILATGIGLLALVIAGSYFKLMSPRAVVTAGIIVSIVAVVAGNALLLRLGDDGGAAYGRVPLIQAAWQMIQSAPFTGVGINNFIVALPDYWGPQFAGEWVQVVHNQYLLIAAERGVFGLVAFIALIASIGRTAWSAAATAPRVHAILAVGVIGAVTARVIHMFVDVFNRPLAWESLMLIAALSVALDDRAPLQSVKHSGPPNSPLPSREVG